MTKRASNDSKDSQPDLFSSVDDNKVQDWPVKCPECGNENVLKLSVNQIRGRKLRCKCGRLLAPWE